MAKVGAYVLETLTTGMYTNPLDTVRELVQNSADSIRKAEEKTLISKGEGRIEIIIDSNKRNLTIRDNGTGIPSDLAPNRLLNVGMSDKDIEKDAGFRGIGRLAAVAYCNSLHFRTSSQGENIASYIDLDCQALKRAVSPNMRQKEELADIIDKNSTVSTEKCDENSHFLEVTLEGVSQTAPVFMEQQSLEKYLCQVAPVEMDSQHFIFTPRILKWLETYRISNHTVTLIIRSPQGERQVFKPHKTHYKTDDQKFEFDVKTIKFFPENPSPDDPFWIWYGETDLLGMVGDERVAGFRFRKNNIAIGGPERVAELFATLSKSYSRINSWYIGEIHIRSKDIIPNARRDGFEDNDAWCRIKEDLMPFIRERRVVAYDTSENRNIPIPKLIHSAEQVITEANSKLKTGFVSPQEKNKTCHPTVS